MSDENTARARARAEATIGLADLFTIGIGPSSSHTVGPMRAAASFAEQALDRGPPTAVSCELFGSLALTGRG
ncbi:L-serine ammonia-lyase, partial [Escherichia coli]|nr:L-serine ammonia-lyase [Escherichia coli]